MERERAGRPVLRPGVRVTTRDDGTRQVGADRGRRVLLPDTEDADRLLAALDAGRGVDLDGPQVRRWVDELTQHGLLVDAEQRDRARRAAASYDVAMAALARHGDDAALRLRARAVGRVLLDAADEEVRAGLARLLAAAGLPTTARTHDAAVRLVVTTDAEPPRNLTDPWMRGGLPHLFLTHRAGRLTVGPFVVPGLTACLRCRDAHEGDRDPGHDDVVGGLGPRRDDRPDPVLLDLAHAWAVRDLVAFVEGDLPATWSTVVEVDPGLTLPRVELTRHPRCGCSWGEGLATA